LTGTRAHPVQIRFAPLTRRRIPSAGDLTVARDFDLGMTGPPMHINMDFIAGGLVEMIARLSSALVLFAYAWWAQRAPDRLV
jgi:hypothetical protein